MKINVRILFITFFIVVLLSLATTYFFYTSTNKILEDQLKTKVLSSTSSFVFNFQIEFEKIDSYIGNSNKNYSTENNNVDFFLVLDEENNIIERNIFSNNIVLNSDSTFSSFIDENRSIIFSRYSYQDSVIIAGIDYSESKLDEYSKKINLQTAFIKDDQVISVSNSRTNNAHLFNIIQSVKELRDKKLNEVNWLHLNEFDLVSSYYPIDENSGFLIFDPNKDGVEFRTTLKQILIVIIVSGVALSLVLVLIFTTKLRKQISLLTETTKKIIDGNMYHRVEVLSKDEIGQLGSAFNKMLDEINKRDKLQIQHLEFISLLNQNPDIGKVADVVLRKIISSTGVKFGALYLVENENIKSISTIGLNSSNLKENNFNYLSVIKEKQLLELHFSENPPVIKTGIAEINIAYMVVAPIIYNNEVIAIVELVNDSAPVNDVKEYLSQITGELGIGLTNSLAFEKLEKLVENLKTLNRTYEKQNTEIKNKNRQLIELHKKLQLKAKELKVEKERAVELTKVKSQFLANVSHELRTPLNSILGLTELVIKDNSTLNKTKNRLDIALRNGKKLLYLISNILEFSKMESGKIDVKIEGFFIKEFMYEIYQFLNPLAKEKKLDFSISLIGCQDIYLNTDKRKLEQITLNLISNAIKFTEDGWVNVKVKVNDKENLFIEVIDSGIGISEEGKSLIFEEFRQIDGTTARKYGGTGLGLAICKKYISLIGGNLNVESELDKGSKFIVSLPSVIEYSIDEAKEESSMKEDLKDEDKKHILIINEDEEQNKFIGNYLTTNDLQISISDDFEDSIKILEETKINTLLLNPIIRNNNIWDFVDSNASSSLLFNKKIIFTSIANNKLLNVRFGLEKLLDKSVESDKLLTTIKYLEKLLSEKIKNVLLISSQENGKNLTTTIVKEGREVEKKTNFNWVYNSTSKYDLILLELESASIIEGYKALKSNSSTMNTPIIIISDNHEVVKSEIRKIKHGVIINGTDNPLELLKLIRSELNLSPSSSIQESLIIEDTEVVEELYKVEVNPHPDTKVLIVDDDHDTLYTVGEIINDLGCNTTFARNGLECLKKMRKVQPDIILLDIMMPQMDGFETIKRIRANEEYKSIPVIALTAHAMLDDKKIIEKNGFDGIITKPINTSILAFKIQKILKWN